MIRNFDHLLQVVAQAPRRTIAVAAAGDLGTLKVVQEAEKQNLASFILIGEEKTIQELKSSAGLSFDASIINEPDERKAAELAVKLVKDKKAHTVMKGMLPSAVFLKAVLDKEKGLNVGRRITQISVIEKEDGGLMFITDCAISIAPDLQGKVGILENAVSLAHSLGVDTPKVAVVSALELVNPNIQETIDAAVLSKMAQRGQIKGCIVDGPLALDNTLSKEAAEAKGIVSEVAGNADIILVPNLTVGNVLSKSIDYIAKKRMISATVGTAVPIVFTSRTESKEGKLLTIALAVYVAGKE